jgi:hypothetical protein
MRQEAKGQLPGIDLTFADGKTGRIWGISGVDDLRGASFEKAAVYLKSRAELDDVFNWTIEINLESVMSYAFTPLLSLISTINALVEEDPDGGRSAKIVWYVRPDDDSMRTIANDVKEHIEKGNMRGLTIEIRDAVKAGRR